MDPCFFIFGFGYTAQALVRALPPRAFRIIGTSSRHIAPSSDSLTLIDFEASDLANYMSLATHLLVSIPPSNTSGDLVLEKYHAYLKKQAPHLQWVGYLSSTGVYGNHHGNWVNEESECMAHTPSAIRRLNAERAWMTFAKETGLPLHVFRLSGIYGPGRNALERIAQGKKQSIFKEDHVFSRIHVEDIASTLIASITHPHPLSIYNVSDNEPAPAHVVDAYAANLLGRSPPLLIPFSEALLSPMEQEFYANNRRISNLKIKNELSVHLKYPTYREGLAQIWRQHVKHK